MPNVLAGLHDLAKNNSGTELRKSLFESLLIYSRNNLTTDLSEKLLFVLVALEALLLRDGSEAIQGNLAERLAFLAGPTLQDRKAIVASTTNNLQAPLKFCSPRKSIEDLTHTPQIFPAVRTGTHLHQFLPMSTILTCQDLVLSLDDRDIGVTLIELQKLRDFKFDSDDGLHTLESTLISGTPYTGQTAFSQQRRYPSI